MISIPCNNCSYQIKGSSELFGRRIRCPKCGASFVIEATCQKSDSERVMEAPDSQKQVGRERAGARSTTLWWVGGTTIVGLLLFIILIASFQTRRHANAEKRANASVVMKVKDAQDFIAQREWDRAIGLLKEAIATKDATEFEEAKSLLAKTQEAQAAAEATKLLRSAELAIQRKDVAHALRQLHEYLLLPQATEKTGAQAIIEEIDLATSDKRASEVLEGLSEHTFQDFAKGNLLLDTQQIQNASLRGIYAETLRRNLPKVQLERERIRRRADEEQLAGKLAKEERRRQEEATKQEKARRLAERKKPRLAPMMEDVNNYPEKYYDKFVYFDSAKIGGDIRRDKNLGLFLLDITSARGKFFFNIVGDQLFFSTSDKIGDRLLKLLKNDSQFFHVKLYCEIRRFTTSGLLQKAIPEAYIYKIEVFNRAGEIGRTLED